MHLLTLHFNLYYFLQLHVYLSGCKGHLVQMALVVWKYSTMISGGQSVMIAGIWRMPGLYVVNLVLNTLLKLFKAGAIMFLIVLEQYG